MPFADQLVGFSTGAKMRGFNHSHAITAAIGARHHHPSHTLLQIARIIRGIAANRVHTLHGFAWRFHVWSLIRNALAILDTAPHLGSFGLPFGERVRRLVPSESVGSRTRRG